MIKMADEVLYINSLIVGAVYACVWKDHKYKTEKNNLSYLLILEVRQDSPSGELVRTNSGNRRFSKLRWFGALPRSIKEIR